MKRKTTLWLVAAGLLLSLGAGAQSVDSRLFAQWIETNEEGTQTLYDLSDGQHYVVATAYSASQCREVHDAYKPGVFYLESSHVMEIVPDGNGCGTIRHRDPVVDVTEEIEYSDLSKTKVNMLFEGEFEHELRRAPRHIEVVNPNTEELNVDDMMLVFNLYGINPGVMARLCAGKQLSLLDKSDGDDAGYSYETWGRGIEAKSWMFTKTGDDALALFYLVKPDEYQEVRLIFSDARLIPVYEQQLARLGYFKQRTRNVEGMKETAYTLEEWEEESDEPTYTLTDDGTGLYHLSFQVML